MRALGGECRDLGEVTTPQLHFITYQTNTASELASEAYYYSLLVSSFCNVIGERAAAAPLVVDAANGVAAPKLAQLAALLGDRLQLRIVNDGTTGGELNHKCGADHVKVTQSAPEGVVLDPAGRYATVDGDGDRLLYFFQRAGAC